MRQQAKTNPAQPSADAAVDNRARGDTARNGRNVIDCYTLRHPLVAVKLAAFGGAGAASKAPKGEEKYQRRWKIAPALQTQADSPGSAAASVTMTQRRLDRHWLPRRR